LPLTGKKTTGVSRVVFLVELAVELLPKWVIHYWKERDLDLCDWGCAQGDGTAALAELLSLSKVTGVDFSPEAIDKAAEQYKAQEFLCADFLGESSSQRWDIIFSSNTLEHFDQPWDVLKKVSAHAKDFLVLLLPFREYERIKEHFYTFEYSNIPFFMDDWALVHSRAVTTAARTPTYWPGEQILLVYLSHKMLSALDKTVKNMEIEAMEIEATAEEGLMIEQARQAVSEIKKLKKELSDAAENSQQVCRTGTDFTQSA
jgi:Methyltransferase domain.